ncbi:hypothetical protein ACEU2D_18200 [Brevibacillus laterosporus]|uniref:hypothetical protein n=1 Tax=Brevibacillus laterosporus TaxID=1465 RepID=UPI0035A5DDEF
MNTQKKVAAARNRSLKELQNGKWREKFVETLYKYDREQNPELRESYKSCLNLMSKAWGINRHPELKKYAEEQVDFLNKTNEVQKFTPAEFVQYWRNRYKNASETI